ncbi:P-loop NTPase [Candidatus Bathyarchaeota archaeon]|nr:P-loop NTPase [Candidatus Bathyarchaeota archaeon]
MADPRVSVIEDRLKKVNKVLSVSSGKGGVGKSLIASTLSLALADKGYEVGLFDIDFTNPSTHIILNAESVSPTEENGVIPPRVRGLKYMSIIYYSSGHVSPLRGVDVSNALIELLAITRWGETDFLVIDMPPGIGDAVLDMIRLVKKANFLVVTTPSKLAFETVRKLASLLLEMRIPIIGVIENMKMRESPFIQEQVEKMGLRFLGEIPFDYSLEEAIGDVNKLLKTMFAQKVKELAEKIALQTLGD